MEVSASCGRPPDLSQSEVSSVVSKYFCFSAVTRDSVKALPGYDDRNYYFQGTTLAGSTGPFLIKFLNNVHTSFSEAEGCYQITQALQAGGLIPQAPEKSRSGQNVLQLHFSDLKLSNGEGGLIDMPYPVYILPFVEGEQFDKIDKWYLIPELLRDIGTKIGAMDQILKV